MAFSIDISTQAGAVTPGAEPSAPPASSVARAGSTPTTLFSGDAPANVAGSPNPGASNASARADHVHEHGPHTDPTDHAVATPTDSGFHSAADKTVFDTRTAANTASALVQRDANGRAQIALPHSTNSTYTTVEEFLRTMHSPGLITGGQITVASATQVSVAAGTGLVRVLDDDVAELRLIVWPATLLTIPNDSQMRHIGVSYLADANGAEVVLKTSFDWDKDTEWPLGSAIQINTNIFPFYNPYKVGDPITNIIQRFDAIAPAMRDNSLGGFILTNVGTRNIAMSAGKVWYRLNDNDIAAKDTSGADRFATAYYNGTAWVYSAGVTIAQWPNTEYNDTASGLVVMDNNKYANLWFYVSLDTGIILMLYGQAQHIQQADALLEAPPTVVPANLGTHTMLVARLTFQKSAGTPSQIVSAFATSFATTPISDHGTLSGLTDDDHPQYLKKAGDVATGAIGFAVGSAALPGIYFDAETTTGLYRAAANSIGFSTSGVERYRIGSGGNHGWGTAPVNSAQYLFGGTATVTGTTVRAMQFALTFPDTATVEAVGILSNPSTAASAFTIPDFSYFKVTQGTLGAGSAITRQHGFWCPALNQGSESYGFRGDVTSAANRWNIYMQGSAQNWMAGTLRLGPANSLGTAQASGTPALQGVSTGAAQFGTIYYAGAVATANVQEHSKSRGAIGVHTIVAASDELLSLRASGSDGTNFLRAGQIVISVDGTPGSGSMPGLMDFSTTPTGSSTPSRRLRIDAVGRLSGQNLHNNASGIAGTAEQYIGSGTYTPTLTGVANVAATTSTANASYIRVGNIVTVNMQLNIDPTAASTLTQLGISLPIASALSAASQLTGTGVRTPVAGVASVSGVVLGDATNDRAELTFLCDADAAARSWAIVFQYQVL